MKMDYLVRIIFLQGIIQWWMLLLLLVLCRLQSTHSSLWTPHEWYVNRRTFFTSYSFLLFFEFDFVRQRRRRESINFWSDIHPGAAGVFESGETLHKSDEEHVHRQTKCHRPDHLPALFDRKQKPAGISLTSVSCDANGQKSWNYSLERWRERLKGGSN